MRIFLLCALMAACTTDPGSSVACTMEAKACPDGSYVGRDPAKNCEFKACP